MRQVITFSALLLILTQLHSASAKTLSEDRFIFKIANEVQSLRDLENTFDRIQDFKCIYQGSLLVESFSEVFTPAQKSHFLVKNLSGYEFSNSDKLYFREFMTFSKLLIYSKSNRTFINSSVYKAFFIKAKRLGCNMDTFKKNNSFQTDFTDIVRLEVFLRLRFLPEEKSGKATSLDFQKAVLSTKNFINSIDKQLSGEVFW